MKNFKNFCLSYFKGLICKRPLEDAKNYFYDFFRKNVTENAELDRLNELKKVVDDQDEIKLIEKEIEQLNDARFRNSNIVNKTESKIKALQEKKSYHESLLQAIWLKNIIKYYPNQEKYILEDYGIYVTEFAKALNKSSNSKKENYTIYCIDALLRFVEEYKFPIRLAIEALKNTKCNLLNCLKINHALQTGYETFLIGSIKTDGIIAAILSDALQYSPNADKFQARVAKFTKEFNGIKVLDIYSKTGQNPSLQEKSWLERKKYQLNVLRTPGTSSFSALSILLIGKKISLYEISKYFDKFEKTYKSENPEASKEMIESYMKDKKAEFWWDYASITENEAKKYFSDLAYILNRNQRLPNFLFDEYEDYFIKVFNDYPIF